MGRLTSPEGMREAIDQQRIRYYEWYMPFWAEFGREIAALDDRVDWLTLAEAARVLRDAEERKA